MFLSHIQWLFLCPFMMDFKINGILASLPTADYINRIVNDILFIPIKTAYFYVGNIKTLPTYKMAFIFNPRVVIGLFYKPYNYTRILVLNSYILTRQIVKKPQFVFVWQSFWRGFFVNP